MPDDTLDHASIVQAADNIRGHVHHTPVLTSSWLDDHAGAHLFFKCENLQRTGAFKIRGATHAVLSLPQEQAARGVATHSSGNHGAALALAGRSRGIPAWIVMPETAVATKQAAVAGYGAKIVHCGPTLADRENTLNDVLEQTGAVYIPPYNHVDVMAGQGTAALELCDDMADLDCVVAPVGGGGLLSGTALAVAGAQPRAAVYGAEPVGADDAWRSFRAGSIVPVASPDTIADGLRATLGPLPFAVIEKHVADIFTVSDAAIIAAMRLLWTRMKLVVEPSGAVPLAAVLDNPLFQGRRVGIVLSGGNVDLDRLPWA